jgi:hypothetical protein
MSTSLPALGPYAAKWMRPCTARGRNHAGEVAACGATPTRRFINDWLCQQHALPQPTITAPLKV